MLFHNVPSLPRCMPASPGCVRWTLSFTALLSSNLCRTLSLVPALTGVSERTFIAVKPDGVQRKLVGEITHRFEKKGFKLVALKLTQVSKAFSYSL